MAQQMLQHRLESLGVEGVRVSSAGTMAMPAHGLNLETSAAMQRLGFEPKVHSAQQLTEELIRDANLVLTSTTDQRADVVELLISANRYAFTLREFAALAEYIVESGSKTTVADHVELLEETKLLRGYGRTLTDLDIADPYQRGAEDADRAANETKQAIEWVSQWLI
jgi:protein-tyrosine phosphatase